MAESKGTMEQDDTESMNFPKDQEINDNTYEFATQRPFSNNTVTHSNPVFRASGSLPQTVFNNLG